MTSVRGFAEVIGDPVSHSRSPIIHRFWLARLGFDHDYIATRVTRADLPAFIAQRRQDPLWLGCNVTMPLKLDALLLADDSSDRAIAAGAANLLVAKDGMLLAGNTDVGGVVEVLSPFVQPASSPPAVTLLGCGGAARSSLVALRMLGIREIRLQARDLTAAYALALEFGLEDQPRSFTAPIDSAGLINATPLGMAGVPPVAIAIGAMPAGGWVFDMVSEPAATPLLQAARVRGLATVDGLAMLVAQAAASFMLLFGHDAPRQHDADLMAMLRP